MQKVCIWFGEKLCSGMADFSALKMSVYTHATFNISAGKIEGINNKIKTLRRKGYGYPDDDYFFLKLFDASRKSYVRNPSSHNFCD